MKKYIILLLLVLPLSVWGQSTIDTTAKKDTLKTKKKGIFKKKSKKTKVVVVQEPQTIVPKTTVARVVNEPDSIVMRWRVIDTTFIPFSGNQFYVTFQKSCYECFRIEELELDSTSNDTLAMKKIRYTFQVTALVHDASRRAQVRRANVVNNSVVRQRAKEAARLEEEAKKLQDEVRKSGN